MFVLLDDEQRYHRQGLSLKDAGIDARRSVELTGVYRPVAPIRAFAEAILFGENAGEGDAAGGAAPPDPAHVAIVEAPTFAAQFAAAADRVRAEIASGVPPAEVAVLVPGKRDVLVARRALAGAGLDPATCLTIDDARGLEFDSVVLANLNEGSLPAGEPGHDLTGKFRDRRRLYVAATRARRRLAIVCQAGLRSSFLPAP
jgi:hypothetical protein